MESRFVEELDEETLRCTICPRMCAMKPGQKGFCGTKRHVDGKIEDLTYGEISAIAVDPIEKKPLAHFYPGSKALSISSVGCSFTCPWCQNCHHSMAELEDSRTRYMDPEEVVEAAKDKACLSIAYTYNEPLINLNYVEDVARLAHSDRLKNVLVTNGYISIDALGEVVDVIDAANVDWKSFSMEFYRKHCSGELQDVLNATKYMNDHGVHIEVTFLVIPEQGDVIQEAREMAEYMVENLGESTPLHLSRFFPQYKFTHIPPTPLDILKDAREIAMEVGLQYVFIGNVRERGFEDTLCPECGKHVVERRGYHISGWHLDEEGRCEKCGAPINIVGANGGRPNH